MGVADARRSLSAADEDASLGRGNREVSGVVRAIPTTVLFEVTTNSSCEIRIRRRMLLGRCYSPDTTAPDAGPFPELWYQRHSVRVLNNIVVNCYVSHGTLHFLYDCRDL
jgi:hypothetical protein